MARPGGLELPTFWFVVSQGSPQKLYLVCLASHTSRADLCPLLLIAPNAAPKFSGADKRGQSMSNFFGVQKSTFKPLGGSDTQETVEREAATF